MSREEVRGSWVYPIGVAAVVGVAIVEKTDDKYGRAGAMLAGAICVVVLGWLVLKALSRVITIDDDAIQERGMFSTTRIAWRDASYRYSCHEASASSGNGLIIDLSAELLRGAKRLVFPAKQKKYDTTLVVVGRGGVRIPVERAQYERVIAEIHRHGAGTTAPFALRDDAIVHRKGVIALSKLDRVVVDDHITFHGEQTLRAALDHVEDVLLLVERLAALGVNLEIDAWLPADLLARIAQVAALPVARVMT